MKQKHIVFLFSDQHNGNIVEYGNDSYIRTPNLKRLASKGTAFNNCYCPSPLCVPSRSAMLSGRLPSETGIFNNFQCLRTDEVTFAHCLSVGGYETVLSGRMHFNGPDQRHGFEKRIFGDMTPSYAHRPKNNYGEALKHADFPGEAPIKRSGAGNSAVLEYDKELTDATVAYLRKPRSDQRPLFLTVGYYGPHCPYVAPKDLYDYYYNILPDPEPITEERRAAMHPAMQQWCRNRKIEDVTVEETKRVQAAYYGMVEYLDKQLGRIIETIDQTLGIENTIIVYGSDHGDTIGDNGVFWKTNFYEGSVRVPLVFSAPGLIQENVIVEENISLLDIGPTFIDYTNSPKLPETHGISQMPVLSGEAQNSNDRIIISQLADVKGDSPSIMIKKGSWKLVHHTDYNDVQLFNVAEDPKEKNDLGKDESFVTLREQLHSEVMHYWDENRVKDVYKRAKAHDEIYKKWVVSADVEPIEEWFCSADKNYLV